VLFLPLDAHKHGKKEIFSPAMRLSLSTKNPKPIRPIPINLPKEKNRGDKPCGWLPRHPTHSV